MGRFDRILTPRLQVEVNVPGFDVARSIAAAAKRVQRKRRLRDQKPAPQVRPEEQERVIVPVSLGDTGQPDPLPSDQAANPKPFAINL